MGYRPLGYITLGDTWGGFRGHLGRLGDTWVGQGGVWGTNSMGYRPLS